MLLWPMKMSKPLNQSMTRGLPVDSRQLTIDSSHTLKYLVSHEYGIFSQILLIQSV